MESREIGAIGGAMIDGMITLAQATKQAVRASAQHQRNMRTVGEWSRALQKERDAKIKAQREQIRLLHEISMLRLAFGEAEAELEIDRNR